MMSSEESANYCGVIENKLLQSKVKRTRQRVDAGEPRNSYSSIPNFSSRPSFLSSGLYSAIFNQRHKHFAGLFGAGFAPEKMLNELISRQVKSEVSSPCDTTTAAMITVDAVTTDNKMNLECLKSSTALHQALDEENRATSDEIAHNMLRDILQGRKKELLALENELRGVSVAANGIKTESLNLENNNNNNNNNLNNNNNVKLDNFKKGALSSTDVLDSDVKPTAEAMSPNASESGMNLDSDNNSIDQENSNENLDDGMCDTRVKTEDALSNFNSNNGSDSDSIPSPLSETKEETDQDPSFPKSPETRKSGLELKRARVENIVSTMRSSPTLPLPVNGCKKRKLYHPQQHDSSAAERYADNGISNPSGSSNALDDSDSDLTSDPRELREKLVEKNALKTQLRTMQEQLAEMQSKYVQLCSRMDQETDCPDADDGDQDIDGSDTEQGKSTPVSVSRNGPSVPAFPFVPTRPTNNQTPSPAVPSLKMHGMGDNQLMLSGINGPLSMIQGHHIPHSDHPGPPLNYAQHTFSNAAAMYLGVNQKLYFDQESRLAKDHSEHHHKQDHLKHKALAGMPHHGPPPPHTHGQPPPHHLQSLQNEMQNRLHSPQKRNVTDFSERLSMFRNSVSSGMGSVTGSDLEGLADILKTEITSSLTNLIDSIINRFVQQRRLLGKQTEAASAAAEQLNKDLLLASQLLDRKSPRTKVIDRTPSSSSDRMSLSTSKNTPGPLQPPQQPVAPPAQQPTPVSTVTSTPANTPNSETNNSAPVRPSPSSSMFQTPKLPGGGMNPAAAAALYSSMSNMGVPPVNPLCIPSEQREPMPEQNEALSLVVAPKKKRHKVTDTRITPRTVSRILAQDSSGPSPGGGCESGAKSYSGMHSSSNDSPPPLPPPPRPYHPPTMLPVSLPTSVAIPNPSLHESQVFSPYSPFFHQHPAASHHHINGSPPMLLDPHRDSPPLPNPPTMLHPALLAAAHHSAGTPDFHFRAGSATLVDCGDRGSEGNSVDGGPFDGLQPSSSTLTPMHLRKAKLMFFWVRYPSSAVLKMYFPDIMFNKNNTAQLVKWFSNFREFYYIQMEKYARQAVSEGVKSAEDIHVSLDSEIYRVLNLHYNRNNHIEVPTNFRFVVEQTLREFFKAIQTGKDTEQSWKKSIYKIISRLDDPVPDYFKSPNFLEQLE